MKSLFSALALLLVLTLPAQAAQRVVLPTGVVPERYAVEAAPDVRALTFQARSVITVRVERPTERIVLNAADLAFDRVALSGRPGQPVIELDPAGQTAAFVFDKPVAPGRYELSIDYRGKINRQPSGLFALDYDSPAGPRRALYTQFENSDARRFMPCWDEPALKAVFSLTLVAPAGQMAVSNMPVAGVTPLGGGRQAVRFQDTPRMSSYLAFLALGDFERISRKVGDVDVGVVVRRGKTAQAAFTLDAAAEILPFYNDYFGAPYPLPKLDILAGPGQSQFFSAMENWGAIFGFEHAVLLDPQTSTDAERQNVFEIAAHEIAHQWFGDLVTMSWWDDLWLNEGFASWMEKKATDRLHPEWRIWLQAAGGWQAAMALDSGEATHPVVTPIPDAVAASNAFDLITYQKGQAVIRMLEAYVGEDIFRAGVRSYIARHAYANTVTDDLWAELDRVSPRPVTAIAHDFTLQPGVPMVRATPVSGRLRLEVSRLGAGRPQTWRTPVTISAPGEAPQTLVIEPGAPLQIPLVRGQVVNAGQAGYFRTAYHKALWRPLARRFASLPAADQLGLIYDTRALGEAGVAPMSAFLDLAAGVQPDVDPVVLTAFTGQLVSLDSQYERLPGQAAFRAFAVARLRPVLARLGWDPAPGETENAAVARAVVLKALGRFGEPSVVAEAHRRFAAYCAQPATLSGSGRETVLAIAAREADPATWDQIHALARAAAEPVEKSRLYRLLGVARDPALADRALKLALSGEPPVTVAPALIRTVSQGDPDRAFDFAVANRAAIEAVLEPTSRSSYIVSLASGSRSRATAERVAAFAAAAVPPSAQGEAAKTVSSIRFRADVVETRLVEIDRWLAANAAR